MGGEGIPGVSFSDLSAGGRVGDLIRKKEWAATPLGARGSWPRSLDNYLSMILQLPTAAIIFWGPEQVQLYNDGYAVIMGPRHPRHLGSTFGECWPEAYATIHPWMQCVLQNGETVEVNRTLVPLTRFGFTEEAYFTFSFSPLRDDDGKIAGILQVVTEVTELVLGERRAAVLHELSNQTPHAKTTDDAPRLAAEVLGKYAADLPFCLIYVVDPDDREKWILSGSTGLSSEHRAFPGQLDLGPDAVTSLPELSTVVRERKLVPIENLMTRFGRLPAGAWPEPPVLAFASPIAAADQQSVAAVLVAGISPRLAFDGPYRGFLKLIGAQLGALLAAARAHDDERKRMEALVEIDRAKTEFFSNVSHEFRTPLTLMLGPLEDALGDPAKTLAGGPLEGVYRNALRLLRLVNNLLDFSRVEAGRVQSRFEATDLPVLTGGLAGSFQSLVESAGLELVVDCPPLNEPVYVDRSQWEKIVLNLISNAFKFTFEGAIVVRLRAHGVVVELSVEDTGTGIPADDLPKIFDRFHRVEGVRGRSFEGSGIGLALVKELAKQHGGSIHVESEIGKGTAFVVTIPRGRDHLSTDRISVEGGCRTGVSAAAPFVLEAEQWVRGPAWPAEVPPAGGAASQLPAEASRPAEARVLVADDNADMREYLSRLLGPRWKLEVVVDGQAALESARRDPPDLIISDVMMPRMDGISLLRELRAEAGTSTIPVILLSARAGEEAVVGGLETGADDYLVKPFSARELLSRVGTHLEMARLRRRATEAATELAETRATLLDDLDRKNKELESFSHSVSHDLRAPLRSIAGFGQALLEDHGGELGAKGQEHLRRVLSAVQRMNELIDDLLELSRVERTELRRRRVDISGLSRNVGDRLASSDPSRSVAVIVEDDLVADADARLVEILLENLLGNAWKFTSRTTAPRVEIGALREAGQATFFVRDNGAGFDQTHAGRLFAPFQRLHSAAQFPGTGIGLATVKRIVDRHGGRLWAEGEVDRGATIYWTLPVARSRGILP